MLHWCQLQTDKSDLVIPYHARKGIFRKELLSCSGHQSKHVGSSCLYLEVKLTCLCFVQVMYNCMMPLFVGMNEI
jgi:hypothetical protein